MRLVSLDYVKDGSKLAQAILSPEGNVLLGKGVMLDKNYIKRLKEMGIASVYIIDERFIELEVKDVVSQSTRQESMKIAKQLTDKLKQGIAIESPEVFQAVNSILDDLLGQETVLLNLVDIRTYDNYTFAHSVNVCILSLLIGCSVGYDQIKIRNLGIGALLHDLGKINIPTNIANKNPSLNIEEYKKLKSHCQRGFELIRVQKDFSIFCAHVALQHHERYDGRGYPQGLKGEDVIDLARIVGIADIYDILSSDRPYRQRYLPHQIYEYMMAACYSSFDPKLVTHFLKHVPPYPNGTIVQLNTNEKGVIVDQNTGCLIRPVVKIFEKNGQPLLNPYTCNLIENPTVLVQETFQN